MKLYTNIGTDNEEPDEKLLAHVWVCDGYVKGGNTKQIGYLFHFNWCDSDFSNGFFYTEALQPHPSESGDYIIGFEKTEYIIVEKTIK